MGRPKKKPGEVYYNNIVLVDEETFAYVRSKKRIHEPYGATVERLINERMQTMDFWCEFS